MEYGVTQDTPPLYVYRVSDLLRPRLQHRFVLLNSIPHALMITTSLTRSSHISLFPSHGQLVRMFPAGLNRENLFYLLLFLRPTGHHAMPGE